MTENDPNKSIKSIARDMEVYEYIIRQYMKTFGISHTKLL